MPGPIYQDEFEQNTEIFERGRILKAVPPDAWEIIYDTVHELVEDGDRQHGKLKPGDSTIVASQAGLYVLSEFEEYFKKAMEAAINFAEKPPAEFLKYLFQVRDRLDVLKQQEGA